MPETVNARARLVPLGTSVVRTIWLSAGNGAASGNHFFGQRPHSVW